MILTCPNCATRYEADSAKFLPAGRKVRCAKCGHVWLQPAPEIETPPPAADLSAEPQAAEPPPTTSETPEVSGATAAIMPQSAAGWRLGALAGWAALIALVAALAWSAVAFRQAIASFWPKTATVYSWVGLDVNTVGLAFEDVSYRVTSEDDMPILHIKGKIVNITERTIAVPEIHASLTDEKRRELYDWKIRPGMKHLAPGKTAVFFARVPSPPMSTRHVDLKFVKG